MTRISKLLFFLPLLLVAPISSHAAGAVAGEHEREEEFSEALLLRPLPDRKVLAHFHFQSTAPPSPALGRHHHLFPKAAAQLVQKFRIKEMELSFTQGRWNYERWGMSDPMSSANAKPPGVELWAVFDVPPDQIDFTWSNLTHSLSGLFCASINFLESSTAYSSPNWGFRTELNNVRYGALPREAVCTENLTPWLKLLPCRDKAGIASLLDRPSIYKGFYHSQRLHLVSTESAGIVVEQTLTVVLQPTEKIHVTPHSNDPLLQPSWTISSLFRNKLTGPCVLAKSSSVYVELEKGMVAELQKWGAEPSWSNLGFDLSVPPDRIIKDMHTVDAPSTNILYEFNVQKYNQSNPLNVGIKWNRPMVWMCSRAPLHTSRFLMGSGNERGAIAISFHSTKSYELLPIKNKECPIQVIVFQIVPWYVKVYYHTLEIFIDGKPQNTSDIVENILVSPSEDKVSPGVMELKLNFPCRMKTAVLTVAFDKGFLHIDEYPPDANQGFDIPSAIVNFPQLHATSNFLEESLEENTPLLERLQEQTRVLSYTEVLLVPLTTPDFSMPYNVITFTCTVLALYFGSLLNVLRRRVGEEERLLSKAESTAQGLIPQLLRKLSSKLRGKKFDSADQPPQSPVLGPKLLVKVIIVALAAVVWHYFLNEH